MKHSVVLALLALLISVTATAGASTIPGPFSTTGYTTNLVASSQFPYPVPSEFEFLPSGYVKFHIQARGGPAFDDDLLCQTVYGAPSCEALCLSIGQSCGVHGSLEGSFSFDEWGVVDLGLAGANDGLLTITTAAGRAKARFGGQADSGAVQGSFQFLGGTGDFRQLQGTGTYTGDAGFVFGVDYDPCGQPGQPACPATLCAAQGVGLKLLRPKAMWTVSNGGDQAVHMDSLLLHWPEQNGALTGVRLGGKTLAAGSWPAPWVEIDLEGAPAADREIRGGQSRTLTLDFENMGIGQNPADYTFLAQFAEECSAMHVAFP